MSDLKEFVERLKVDGYPTAHVERQIARMTAMEQVIVDQNTRIEELEAENERLRAVIRQRKNA